LLIKSLGFGIALFGSLTAPSAYAKMATSFGTPVTSSTYVSSALTPIATTRPTPAPTKPTIALPTVVPTPVATPIPSATPPPPVQCQIQLLTPPLGFTGGVPIFFSNTPLNFEISIVNSGYSPEPNEVGLKVQSEARRPWAAGQLRMEWNLPRGAQAAGSGDYFVEGRLYSAGREVAYCGNVQINIISRGSCDITLYQDNSPLTTNQQGMLELKADKAYRGEIKLRGVSVFPQQAKLTLRSGTQSLAPVVQAWPTPSTTLSFSSNAGLPVGKYAYLADLFLNNELLVSCSISFESQRDLLVVKAVVSDGAARFAIDQVFGLLMSKPELRQKMAQFIDGTGQVNEGRLLLEILAAIRANRETLNRVWENNPRIDAYLYYPLDAIKSRLAQLMRAEGCRRYPMQDRRRPCMGNGVQYFAACRAFCMGANGPFARAANAKMQTIIDRMNAGLDAGQGLINAGIKDALVKVDWNTQIGVVSSSSGQLANSTGANGVKIWVIDPALNNRTLNSYVCGTFGANAMFDCVTAGIPRR